VHGRIQRIAYKQGKPSRAPRLDVKNPKSLVEGLKSDNLLWRMHAQRLIVENDKSELIPDLAALTTDKTVDELGLNPAAVHALYALEGLGAIEKKDSRAVAASFNGLHHPSAAVRRNAVTVLPRTEEGLKAILDRKLLADAEAQVRLAALLAISEMPPSDLAGPAIVEMLLRPENSDDRWIPEAATAAAARHDVSFLKTVLASFKPAVSSEAAASSAPNNLIANSSFEEITNERPTGWRTVTHSGRAQFSVADQGHSGRRSVKISAEDGADASWAVRVPVKPRSEYRLTGWIKTEGAQKRGGAHGAMFNIHEMQDPVRGGTRALVGDNDWTQVSLNFNSGSMTEITINCLFGASRGRLILTMFN
jgi:hypothetical protein